MMWIVLSMAALAQESVETPQISAQNLRMSVDGREFFGTDLSGVAGGQRGHFRFLAGYANRPLVYENVTQGEQVAVVRDLGHLDLAGGYSFGPARFGVHIPLYYMSGDNGSGGGLGDLSADLRLTLLNREKLPVGLALNGRVVAPTSTLKGMAGGSGGVGWEGGVIADLVVGPVTIAVNTGVEGQPTRELDGQDWGARYYLRGGVAAAVSPAFDLTLEADSAFSLGSRPGDGSLLPAEALLGGLWHTGKGLGLQAGVGTGLSRGVGTPTVRALLGIVYERRAGWDKPKDVKEEIVQAPVCAAGEVVVGDACVPAGVNVKLRFVDPAGREVSGVRPTLGGSSPTDGAWTTPAGTYELRAEANGFQPVAQSLVVPDTGSFEAVVTLQPAERPAILDVRVVDENNQPIAATVEIDGADFALASGSERFEAVPGSHVLWVRAQGYGASRVMLNLASGAEQLVEVMLQKSKADIKDDRIDLRDTIYFETDKDIIKAESYPLLAEVASILLQHPEIKVLSIEGHTDNRGSDAYNLDLSRRRAAAVVTFLTAMGVEPGRLRSEGFGESRPISKLAGEAGWSLNRRVDMIIIERGEMPTP